MTGSPQRLGQVVEGEAHQHRHQDGDAEEDDQIADARLGRQREDGKAPISTLGPEQAQDDQQRGKAKGQRPAPFQQ